MCESDPHVGTEEGVCATGSSQPSGDQPCLSRKLDGSHARTRDVPVEGCFSTQAGPLAVQPRP